jgi:natural product precursor
MKKKILGKLSLGKRSIASLSDEKMTDINGGNTGNSCNVCPSGNTICFTDIDCNTRICGATRRTCASWNCNDDSMPCTLG